MTDLETQLERKSLDRRLEAAAARYPNDRVILFVDRREIPPRCVLAIVGEASAWFPLLPPGQIAEIQPRSIHEPGDSR